LITIIESDQVESGNAPMWRLTCKRKRNI